MAKLPSFQMYPGDWRKDPGVQALSFHDRGVWFEIMLLMHESERRGVLLLNGKKMPTEALGRLLGLDNQILTTTLTTILEYGVASIEEDTGALMCRRMVRDENLRQVRRTAGSKGGNPALVKQKPTTQVKQNPTPSSSSSASAKSLSDTNSLEVLILKEKERLKQKKLIPTFYGQESTASEIARWCVFYETRHGSKFNDFQLDEQLRRSQGERRWSPEDLEKSISFSISVGAKNWLDPANDKDKPRVASFSERMAVPSESLALPVRVGK